LKFLNENINDIKETQKLVEEQFQKAVNQPNGSLDYEEISKNLKTTTHSINRSFKQNPLGTDIFQKIEVERFDLSGTNSVDWYKNLQTYLWFKDVH